MKLIMLFAGLGVMMVSYAQDTTRNRPIATDTSSISSPATPRPQPTTPARTSDEYTDKDKVPVELDQLPMAVQQSLRDPNYAGIDQSSIFQDRITGDYIIEVKRGSSTKAYRFNKNGKLLEDPNKPRKKE